MKSERRKSGRIRACIGCMVAENVFSCISIRWRCQSAHGQEIYTVMSKDGDGRPVAVVGGNPGGMARDSSCREDSK